MNVLNAVGHLSGIGQFLSKLFNLLCALGNLLDKFHVTGRETCSLFGCKDVLHALYVLDEFALIVCGNRDDVVHSQIAQDSCLNLHGLDEHFPFHLITCLQFLAVHHLGALKHLHTGIVEVALEDDGARFLNVKTATSSLLDPFVRIAVTIETDGLARLDIVAQYIEDGTHLIITISYFLVYTLLERLQCFSHSRIQGYHSRCAVGCRAWCSEFEAVAGKGKG